MSRLFVLLMSVAALGSAQAVLAKRIQTHEQFNTIWLVEPSEPPLGPVSTPPRGMVLKQRLLPMGLAKLNAAFPGMAPEDVVPVGAELVQARGPHGSVYCSTRHRPPRVLPSALVRGRHQSKHLCFVDLDNDGNFEAIVAGTSDLPTLPSPFGTLPKRTSPIAPLPYEKADPRSFSERYFVGVQYFGQAVIGTLRRFHVAFGSDGNWDEISDNLFTKRDSDLPKTLEIMGAAITVRGGEGKNLIATVEKTMPPQPFGVVRTTLTY